jgi:hypothetical protein
LQNRSAGGFFAHFAKAPHKLYHSPANFRALIRRKGIKELMA